MTDPVTPSTPTPLIAPVIQPYQSYLPTAFSDDLTLLQKVNYILNYLNTVTTTVNNAVTTVNGFSSEINTDVVNQLNTWNTDGTLASLINQTIFTQINSDLTNLKGVSVYMVFNPRQTGETDDTARLQRALNNVKSAGGGRIILEGITYTVSAELDYFVDGVANFTMQGVAGQTILQTSQNITVLSFNSTNDVATTYADRIQHVYLRDFHIIQTTVGQGTGLSLRNFGFIGFDNINIEGFNYNFDLFHGSEFVGRNLRGASGNVGLYIHRDTTYNIGGDMASIVLLECNFHNVSSAPIIADGVRQVVFVGGSLMATGSTNGNWIKATKNTVDFIGFNGTNFENDSNAPAIKIGDGVSTNTIAIVNFEGVQLTNNAPNKIDIVSQLDTLNLKNSSVDTNHNPTFTIETTQSTTPKLNIENCYPYWISYNLFDKRSTTAKTTLNLHRETSVIPFNHDMSRSYYGWFPNTTPNVDTTNFVTGTQAITFTQNGSEQYLQASFYVNGLQFQADEGSEVTVEYIAKFGGQSPGSIPYMVLVDKTTSVQSTQACSQVFAIQGLSNGFSRRFTKIIVPSGKRLIGIRLTNVNSPSTDLTIDYLTVHSKDIPVCAQMFAFATPTGGNFNNGERIRIVTPTAGSYEGYVYVSGVWKGFGAVQA